MIRIVLVFIAAFITSLSSSLVRAESDVTSLDRAGKSTFELFTEKFRARTFTEFMTPALSGNSSSVPDLDSTSLMPTNTFNIFWFDYEIAPDIKILYWQRVIINFAATPTAGAFDAFPRNPRFAIRKVNVFKNPNLSTTYDLYIQPGLAAEAVNAGRNVEFGFRTNTSYTAPGSRWSIGAITENTGALSSRSDNQGANFYGWVMPWTSYDISKKFSTQHYATINYQHNRGTQGMQLDLPKPYMQNGMGVSLSKQIWVAAFINNYLITTPTLKNTWASVWLALTML